MGEPVTLADADLKIVFDHDPCPTTDQLSILVGEVDSCNFRTLRDAQFFSVYVVTRQSLPAYMHVRFPVPDCRRPLGMRALRAPLCAHVLSPDPLDQPESLGCSAQATAPHTRSCTTRRARSATRCRRWRTREQTWRRGWGCWRLRSRQGTCATILHLLRSCMEPRCRRRVCAVRRPMNAEGVHTDAALAGSQPDCDLSSRRHGLQVRQRIAAQLPQEQQQELAAIVASAGVVI